MNSISNQSTISAPSERYTPHFNVNDQGVSPVLGLINLPIQPLISEIVVRRISGEEIDASEIQSLRREINLDSHFQIDPDFIVHEKKEMN